MSKICINCGLPVLDRNGTKVTQLYDEKLYKKSKILKLLQCEVCDKICDRYLEYEGPLILLDLALQNKSAYRHVLINKNHAATILKMSLLTLIVEGYCRWATFQTGGQFFEQEFQFYTNVGEALASLVVFLLVSIFIILNTSMVKPSVVRLVLGLLLAYCTRFLKLAALLWVTTDTTFLWNFVDFFFLITSIKVVQVLTNQHRTGCGIAMSVSHLAMMINDRSRFIFESNPVHCL
eukprot:GFUD01038580.1.p1 GENE.GFUD01038580.1~~GFUD01038580.1.p1  ORF type:complete len:235 (-),score=37.35 GFUD01038580.1:51-755(-)